MRDLFEKKGAEGAQTRREKACARAGMPKALSARQVYRLQRSAAERRQLAEAKAGPASVTPTVVSACRDEALLNLLLYTGLRVAEAAALQVEDVVLSERSGKVIVRAGKGRKYREVPLHREARRALRDYLAVRPSGQGESLFLGQRGPLSGRGIQLRLAAPGEAADVKITAHVLRHTFRTRLLREAEANPVTVSRLMGHESAVTTVLYTQPTEADLVEAVEGVEWRGGSGVVCGAPVKCDRSKFDTRHE